MGSRSCAMYRAVQETVKQTIEAQCDHCYIMGMEQIKCVPREVGEALNSVV